MALLIGVLANGSIFQGGEVITGGSVISRACPSFFMQFKLNLVWFVALVVGRVSKSCNHAITRLRNIFENLCKFWTKENKTGKTATNFMYLSHFDKLFLV